MKSKKFLFVLSSHCSFHGIEVLLDLFIFLLSKYSIFDFNLFLYFLVFFWGSLFWVDKWFLNWISSRFLFLSNRNWLLFFDQLFSYLFRRFSWLGNLFSSTGCRCDTLWWYFVLRIFWLEDLFDILRVLSRHAFYCISTIILLFFYIFSTLYLLRASLFLYTVFCFQTIFWLRFCFTFIVFSVDLIDLVILFAIFRLIFQTLCISKCIETVIGWRTAWRYASNHYYLTGEMLIDKRVSENQGEFRCSKRYMISLIVHCSNTLFES